MSKSVAELHSDLISTNQIFAANIVALMEKVVDGRVALLDIDINELTAGVQAIVDLLDGNKDSEGFQTFLSLVSRVTALETTTSAQATALTTLTSLVNTEIAGLKQVTADLAASFKTSIDALKARIETLEDNATAAMAARLLKDNEHDGKLATIETTSANTIKALQDEVTGRVAAVKVNKDAIDVERNRVDVLEADAEDYLTRQERSENEKAGKQAAINTLWESYERPAGLPNTDGSVSQ